MIVTALSVVAFAIGIYWNYFSRDSIPNEAIRLHLKLAASSIYEFHKTRGRWPTSVDDLASTSLPQVSPYWRLLIENGSVTVVWRTDLKADPKDNASSIMTYHNAGLLSKLGRVWVCWGDLRTESVTENELRTRLAETQSNNFKQ